MFLILRRPIVWYNSCVKLILVFLLLLCAPFAGWAQPPVSLPSSEWADTEAETNVAFRAVIPGRLTQFDISLQAVNTGSNWIELQFADSEEVRQESIDFAFGIADGTLFARGRGESSRISVTNDFPAGQFGISVSATVNGEGRVVECEPDWFRQLLSLAKPRTWRSLRAVARRNDGFPAAVDVNVAGIGTHMILR